MFFHLPAAPLSSFVSLKTGFGRGFHQRRPTCLASSRPSMPRLFGFALLAATLVVGASAQCSAQTLIRVDLGGNGFPDAGFVEYKASSTYADRIAVDTDRDGVGTIGYTESHNAGGAWFGSTGSNIWDHRDISGSGSNLFSGLLDTATGSATGIALTINNANRSNDGGQEGDWRGSQLGVRRINAGGLNAASGAGMNWTITGLLANTATELWIYANDKNYDGTAYTVTGATTVSLIDPARYSGNWTKRDESSIYNGYGWGMTVTTDSSGTLTGWAKENSEIRGLQIYQPSATVTWVGPVDGNWSSASTWSTGAVPTNSTPAVINTASLVTVDGTHAAASLAVSNQGKLAVSTGNSLAVSGPITVAAVSAGSGVTMAHNTTLSAQRGSIASLSVGGNATINVTGAGQKLTVPVYTVTAASALTKGGAGELVLAGNGTATPYGNTTAINLNGGTLNLSVGGESSSLSTPSALSSANARFEANSLILSNGAQVDAWSSLVGSHVANRTDRNMNLATNALNGHSVVQFRNEAYANITGNLYSAEQYVVVKIVNGDWGAFMGSDQRSGYMLNQNGNFWDGNTPNAVSKNGVVLPSYPFALGENREFMLVKIDGNDNQTSQRTYSLGRSEGWRSLNMDLAELISFDHNLSTGEERDLGAYLATKYGLTTSYGTASYAPLVSGNLDMSTTPLTVMADTTLNANTTGTSTFGSLSIASGVVTAKGSPGGITFTGNTSVNAGATGGVTALVPVNIGSLTIDNGGTFVGSGPITSSGVTLTGASGGVNTGSTFGITNYNDGGVNKTLRLGGAGTVSINNTANTFVAANTTLRLTGATVNTTSTSVGNNDPLGGSTAIELAGGKLQLQGYTTSSSVAGLSASLFNNAGRAALRFQDANSLLSLSPIATAIDTGLGNSNGPGINYNGNFNTLFPDLSSLVSNNDNFEVLWRGEFHAPDTGNYNMNSYWGDDAYSVYVDLNQDHVFTANEMRSEGGLGGGQGSFNLTSGQVYDVAFGFREDGGGENVGYRLYGPGAYNDSNVNPSASNQSGLWTSTQLTIQDINRTATTVRVDASSELNAVANSAANFGALTLNQGTLTLSGAPSMTFTGTTITPGATQVGISNGTGVTPNLGVINGNAFAGTFIKAGAGNYVLNSSNVGMGNATFDVQGGKLVALTSAGLGGAGAAKLSATGVELLLSSSSGNQAYNISLDATQNGTLRAAKYSGAEASGSTITLGTAAKNLTVRNGKTLTVATADSYGLNINNSLSLEDNAIMTISTVGSGANINVNILGATTLSMGSGSTINLNAGTMTTDKALSVYNLNLNGGGLVQTGSGAAKNLYVSGTLKVDNSSTNLDLTNGAALTTAGDATINLVNGTITTDSALNVGNLTVEAGGTLNRTGALAADRNVSVGDKLRLANKTFSTVGSALSVGNLIELENSTLAFDNNLSLNRVNMNNYSVFTPGAGTTTTIGGNLEMYNYSSANFTGRTLAMTNRLDVRGYSTLTIANSLTLNGDLEFHDHAIVDFGSNVLTTNQDRELRINDGSELRVPSSSNLNIRYLEIQGGKLTAGSVNISDRIYFNGKDSRTNNNVHSFNITQASSNRYIDVNGDSIRRNPADGSSDTHLTGTNSYTGNTNIGNAAVLVASQGVGLPALSTVRFRDGVLGTSGTFTREIGTTDEAGQVYWDNQGGFAAYGGNLTVSLKPNGGAVNGQLQYGSSNAGFNGQVLYLGSTNATHDVTITNPIEINSGTNIQTWSRSRMATLSGNLTGTSEINKNEGPGTLALTGTNSGYTGTLHIRRGAVDVGLNGAGLGGTQQVWLRADTSDWMNWYGAVLQGQGTLTKEISDNNTGGVFWDQEAGGFAARGGAFNVTLDGGGTLNWGEGQTGFNGRALTFGSTTSDNVVTLTNNIDAQNGYRTVVVMDNPNSANDKAVLGGNLTNLSGFEKRGTGTLETQGNAGLLSTSGEQVRIYNSGTLKVLGNLRAGNAYSGEDPRLLGASENNIELREGAKLIVTGNTQANFFYLEDNGTSSDTESATITGNLNIKDRIETNNGSVTVGGNLISGEGYNIRNKSNVVINGNAQVGYVNGNSADRDVYVENGGDLTFNGNVLTNKLQATGKNSDGRGSTIHVNGTAIVGNAGASNMHFNADNPTTGGGLTGSGTVNFNFANFENGARLGGTLTLNVKDRIVFEGNNSILAPGNGAGTLTVNGSLTLNGGSHYYFDAGDMVNVNTFADSTTGSELVAADGWNLDFKTGGSALATGGSVELFRYTTLGSFDLTPNYNVADLITAGWIPNNFNTSTLSMTASGGVVTLFGLQQQAIIWTGDSAAPGDNLWSTSANWTTPARVGNSLTFSGTARAAQVNDMTAGSSFAGLQFDSSTAAFTITGNAIALTGNITSASANTQTLNLPISLVNTVTVNTGTGNIAIGGALSGGGGLTKQGVGKLTLSGANTFTGVVSLSGGVLSVATIGNGGVAGGLGQADSAAANLVLNGGTLQYTGASASTDRSFTINAGQTATFDIDSGSTDLTLSGASAASSGGLTKTGAGTLTLAGTHAYTGATAISGGTLAISNGGSISTTSGVGLSNNATIAFNQSSNTAFSPVISGAGSLVKDGSGALTVSGDNTFSGSTTVSGGTLVMGHANALGNASNPVVLNAGTLNLNGNSLSVGSLSGGSAGRVSNSSASTTAILTANAPGNSTFSGLIQDGSGSVGLTKSGVGSLTLAGANSYSGATTVAGGTLVVNGSIQTNVSVAGGAFLGGSGTIGDAASVGRLSGAGTISPGSIAGAAGILSAYTFNPSAGLGAAFEFTSAGLPDFTQPANSRNDVLNLTSTVADPFAGSGLTSANAIDIYFNVNSILPGATFTGGFYTNSVAGDGFMLFAPGDLSSAVASATYTYWVKSAGSGVRTFNGVNYDSFTSNVTLGAVGASLDGGLGSGFLTEFVVVPEPDTIALAGLGIAMAAWSLWKRRRIAQLKTGTGTVSAKGGGVA